jgi:hypothetical protein
MHFDPNMRDIHRQAYIMVNCPNPTGGAAAAVCREAARLHFTSLDHLALMCPAPHFRRIGRA